MRRPDLAVAVNNDEQHKWNKHIHLTQSPSIYDKNDFESTASTYELDIITPQLPEYHPPKPSIRLLYSFCTRRDILIVVLPAILTSMLAGGMAPFMTLVIGQAFDAFAQFPLTPNPPQHAKQQLLHAVGFASLELIALAAGQLAFSSLMSSLWIWTGERNVMRLRKRVYDAITAKSMTWYDLKLGGDADSTVGAGGLMAKFSRETDDVRTASALTAGMIIQHLVTLVTCLVLAFARSYSLTLVILSTVPLVMVVQTVAQRFGIPLYERERAGNAKAGTLLERAISNIATVKAFNASSRETNAFDRVIDDIQRDANKGSTVWGVSLGFSQFQSMTLFIQAFGFGSKLVRDGHISPGDVMAVFWACLIGATSIQSAVPFFQAFAKGQMSMAALVAFIEQPTPDPSPDTAPKSAIPFSLGSTSPKRIRGICPSKCSGEFTLRNVTFAYPSRPEIPVLQDVSLYLPAQETTFIVGGSGSGKSTIAQLLLGMYEPQDGSIELDNQMFSYIDAQWTQRHISAVNQGCVLFDMSVHDNVAMGLASAGDNARPHERATRSQVVSACRVALMHEFIRDLPEGYDTRLGTGGANLSGGQKQRLAIARAWMRDPTVLILDEATSALDVTSRLLVFEAIKSWRKNKTTIVITHDLSQINPGDFVYLLKDGRVVEQGYRVDLEQTDGEFRAMADTQGQSGFPEKFDSGQPEETDAKVEALLDETEEDIEDTPKAGWAIKHQSLGGALRPLTGAWMFDVINDMRRAAAPHKHENDQPLPLEEPVPVVRPPNRRHSSIVVSPVTIPPIALTHASRRISLQFSPLSAKFSYRRMPSETDFASSMRSETPMIMDEDDEFEMEKWAIKSSGIEAGKRRVQRSRSQRQDSAQCLTVHVDHEATAKMDSNEQPFSVLRVLKTIYPTIPNKPLVAIGLFTCLLSGAMTPVFSFMLSRLFFEVSAGAKDVGVITKYALITLAVAAADGSLAALRSILMENAAVRWMSKMRKSAFSLILAQDKAWFDNPVNSAARLLEVVIKDADDAKRFLSICMGMSVVVATMLLVGLVWAMVSGWQLTLVGVAIVPLFAGAMSLQTRLISKFQLRNKRAREEVSKIYYEAISNVRSIRAMSLQSVFASQFDVALAKALRTGVRGAFVEGSTFGVTNAMIYLSEALLFYVGAIMVAKGTYTYLQMVQILDLLVFSVSIAAQMMVFVDKITKSAQAAHDMHKILTLSTDTQESQGSLRPTIRGRVAFRNVTFAYPQRPDVPVLKDVSLDFTEGECVAIVGSSGSGKSTIAALLQRLYEPSEGTISVGKTNLAATEVNWLREHISVVSQNPHLFDTTIHENIAYGASEFPFAQVRRAAKAANVHEFVMSLPKDYNTCVGENASLISGGQAQRLQIARALVRPCNVLILDECTSALDAANQAAVMETVRRVKIGRTTVLITHKLPLMRMCDRIVVMHEGAVVEQGNYQSLMDQRGAFFKLANAGEWSTDQ
ncbi:P-loop containing nucleoside triphosphate hydrolase protein [Ramaria rubella]|nr:P-loop containing nucleoside triphosphate hydrolase protein [Ramaria rubella]